MEWMGKTLPRFTAGFQRQYARRRHFLFAHLRAYAIRPYIFWQTNYHMPAAVIPVRSPQGVCDTPLHFLANKLSYARRRHSLFAHIRAYAIRPYNFWQTNYHMPAAVISCSLT